MQKGKGGRGGGNSMSALAVVSSPAVGGEVASFPGPRRGGEKGLVSTVCACA